MGSGGASQSQYEEHFSQLYLWTIHSRLHVLRMFSQTSLFPNVLNPKYETHTHKISKPNLTKTKSKFQVHHLLTVTGSVFHLSRYGTLCSCSHLFLFETDINNSIPGKNHSYPRDSHLIAKHVHQDIPNHRFITYIKDGFPCGRSPPNLPLSSNICAIIFTPYRP